jgi:hypothetical protein
VLLCSRLLVLALIAAMSSRMWRNLKSNTCGHKWDGNLTTCTFDDATPATPDTFEIW